MQNIRLSEDGIRKKVASGIVILGARRVLAQVILTGSNIVLARLLAPQIFGAFAIIGFLVSTLGLLTFFGLAPALIQKKGMVTKRQLRAIFTALFLSSLVFVLAVFLLVPLVDVIYKGQLGSSGIFWLRLFSLNLFLINLALVSSSLLEKRLDYKKVTVGELSILFLTQVLVIGFALKGFGVGSFVLGNLLARLFGFFFLFYLSPWPIGLNFSYRDLKDFLPFGLNFQVNGIINAINGAVVPGFVGAVSGSQAVGLVNWAGGIRQAGLAPSEMIGRLVFPACAQAQARKKFLKSLIEKMIQVSCMLSFPLLAAIFALAPGVTYIVYTSKWLPGLTALYLSLIQGIFLLIGGILIQLLFALGQARTVRNISLFWAVLQWVLTVPLVLLWNFNGVVLAGLLVSATFFIPLQEVRKKVEIDIWPHVLPYLGYSVLTGLVMFELNRRFLADSLIRLLTIGLAGALFYWGVVLLFKRREIIRDFTRLKELLVDK